MRQFYLKLNEAWFDEPQVLLAFGVPFVIPQFTGSVTRRKYDLQQAICCACRSKSLNDIDVQVFLKLLYQKGVLHTLPASLEAFKNLSLLEDGPYGRHYCDLFSKNWFNSKDVVIAFGAQLIKNQERVQFIREAIYWDLGVVSFTQIAPIAFYNYLKYRGIEKTLPVSLKVLIEQGGGHA